MKKARHPYTLFIRIALFLICILMVNGASAQERTVENRPYYDLRPMHFGVVVGTHWQGLEFESLANTVVTDKDGNVTESVITAEQDRWDNGFHVGVLGEFRLSDYFALRVAPILYFGNKHITFRNFSERDANDVPLTARQDMKTVYISGSLDLIYAAKRFNNHRPYVMAGVAPMLNLSTKSNDYLQLKRGDVFLEVGMGCDFYLPFFKLRPELKFMYSLGNSLNTDHYKKLRDPNMMPYSRSITKAQSSIIALTFYFE